MKVKRILLKAIDWVACFTGGTGICIGILYGMTYLWTKFFDLSDEAIEAHPILGVLKIVGYYVILSGLCFAVITFVWDVIFARIWDLIDDKFPDGEDDFKWKEVGRF